MSKITNPYKRRRIQNSNKGDITSSISHEIDIALNGKGSGTFLSNNVKGIQPNERLTWKKNITERNENNPELCLEPNSKSNGRIVLIFDTETTGKIDSTRPANDPIQPDIIQLGMLLVEMTRWNEPLMKISVLVSHERDLKMDPHAQAIHGISLEKCKKFGIPLKTALHLFKKAVESADILVAHNLSFDLLVIETALFRVEFDECLDLFKYSNILYKRQHVCTMKISTDILQLPCTAESGKFKWPSLSETYFYFFKKSIKNYHDALADAVACSEIFRRLFLTRFISLENCTFPPPVKSMQYKVVSPSSSQINPCEKHNISPPITSLQQSPIQHASAGTLSFERRYNSAPLRLFPGDQSPLSTKKLSIPKVTPSKNKEMIISRTKSGFLVSRKSHNSHEDNEGFRIPQMKRPKRGDLYFDNSKDINELIFVKGKTYQYKDELKSLGGRWSPEEKGWYFEKALETILFKYVYGFRI